MEIKEFKLRASASGKLYGVKGLGETGKTYVKDWLLSQLFNRKVKIKSKYLEKGNVCEDESIQFIGQMLNIEISKNVEYFEDEFFTGTPDILLNDRVIDVKNSWDWSTFPYLESEIPNKDYFLQLQIYMHLTGLKKAMLIYVLSDTPENLIEREAYNHCKSLGLEELEYEIFEQFQKDMTYSDIEDKNKIKIFSFEYDEKVILKLKSRVLECRVIADELINNL